MTGASKVDDVERFRGMVARDLGLYFDETRVPLLAEVLARRAEACGKPRGVYLDGLERGRPARDDLRVLAQELTVGETYFFRYKEQLHALAEVLRGLPRLRAMSAGCATGEEPYSLAMTARERFDDAEIAVTGVDVNAAALATASRGRYSEWSLRETPPEARRRWFLVNGREHAVQPSIRKLVRLEECNLVEEAPGVWLPESYDVIFCRNVLMYMTPAAARAVVARIFRALVPGGHLFLGHAETLRGLSEGFSLCHTHGTFYYRRQGGAAPLASDDAAAVVPWSAPVRAADEAWADAWIETVQRSTDRVEELSARSGGPEARRLEGSGEAARTVDVAGALELLRQDRFAEALLVLTDPTRTSSRDGEALLLEAVLLTLTGRLAEAERIALDLCRTGDLNAGVHYLLALCREGAGDLGSAEEHDRTAAYLDPGFAMPRLHRGLLARRQGDWPRARHELEQALTLLAGEDAMRILLFGGGFSREALMQLCRSELLSMRGGR